MIRFVRPPVARALLFVAIFGALAVGGGSFGKPRGEPKTHHAKSCWDTAMTQGAMNECADAKYRAVKARFDKSWRAIMGYIDDEKDCADLKATQKAWLAYRDAECGRWGNAGGTVEVMDESLCLASLTEARIKDLDAWPPLTSRKDQKPLPNQVCKP
jgi:uncharacterized protein YecT (DUF1311 family)